MEKDYFMVIVWCLIPNCNDKFLILGTGWIFDEWKRHLWSRRSAGWKPEGEESKSEDGKSLAIPKTRFRIVEAISYDKQDVDIKEKLRHNLIQPTGNKETLGQGHRLNTWPWKAGPGILLIKDAAEGEQGLKTEADVPRADRRAIAVPNTMLALLFEWHSSLLGRHVSPLPPPDLCKT